MQCQWNTYVDNCDFGGHSDGLNDTEVEVRESTWEGKSAALNSKGGELRSCTYNVYSWTPHRRECARYFDRHSNLCIMRSTRGF
jgi:hypothetical protein